MFSPKSICTISNTWGFLASLFVCIAFCMLSLEAAPPSPLSVKEAEFRARWVGQQADRQELPHYFQPGGGLDDSAKAAPSEEEPKQNWMNNVDHVARDLSNRLKFGPLDFSMGLNSGWQFSSQNSLGSTTDSTSSTSLFSSPSASARYEREVGVWALSSRLASGYTYFYNPDYTSAGQGSQRNPISASGGVDLNYNTSRLTLSLGTTASSGNGYDIISGVNNLQTSIASSLSARYVFSEQVSAGGALSVSYSNNADAQAPAGETPQEDSTTLNTSASIFGDYLVTPKTNLRLVLSSGQEVQKFYFGTNQGRRHYSGMFSVTYQIAPKFSVDAGAGIGHVTDEDLANAPYTGFKPNYNLGISYAPTEKTYLKTSFGLQGTDVRPNFSFVAGWNAREKTRFSMSAYQNQSFSTKSPNQYNINRGVLVTVAQRLIKGIDASLSGGYEQSMNVGLSSSAAVDGPSDYFLTNFGVSWRLREWASWQNSFMLTTGQGTNDNIRSSFSTSLNLTF